MILFRGLITGFVIAAADQINSFVNPAHRMADISVHIISKDAGIEKSAPAVVHVCSLITGVLQFVRNQLWSGKVCAAYDSVHSCRIEQEIVDKRTCQRQVEDYLFQLAAAVWSMTQCLEGNRIDQDDFVDDIFIQLVSHDYGGRRKVDCDNVGWLSNDIPDE